MNVQMNVRIDEKLKRAGDEVFDGIGLSATQVVRSVWEYAALHREAPEIVRAALGLPPPEGERLRAEIAEASSVCARLRERFGLHAPDGLEQLDYRKLRERALYEKMEDRGL